MAERSGLEDLDPEVRLAKVERAIKRVHDNLIESVSELEQAMGRIRSELLERLEAHRNSEQHLRG